MDEKERKREEAATGLDVDIVAAENLTYETFFRSYLKPNKPVLITGLGDKWRSWKEWRTGPLEPNFDFLREHFSHCTVPVVRCTSQGYGEEERFDMEFGEYLEKWQRGELLISEEQGTEKPLLYMKDWHFVLAHPEYEAYDTPTYFADDWLNRWWERNGRDDYKFVYMGPKGTWTPLHHDVFKSNSWSINICGIKEWTLFPPSEQEKLKDRLGRRTVPDIRLPPSVYGEAFPSFSTARKVVLQQRPGTAIFVPSGWYHQVVNLTDCISINHNWFNGSSIVEVSKFLLSELQAVEREIWDCRQEDSLNEWLEQCQLIMRCNTGMDLKEFASLLVFEAERALSTAPSLSTAFNKRELLHQKIDEQDVQEAIEKDKTTADNFDISYLLHDWRQLIGSIDLLSSVDFLTRCEEV